MRTKPQLLLFVPSFLLFVILSVTLSVTLESKLYDLWTNLFFLWPIVRAIFMPEAAWTEATVFLSTFVASSLHHACYDGADGSLLVQMYALLIIGIVVTVIAASVRLAYKRKRRLCEPLIIIAVGVALIIALIATSSDECVSSTRMMGRVDLVCAVASIVVVVVYVARFSRNVGFALFWALIVLTLVLAVGYEGTVSIDSVPVIVLIVITLIVVARIIYIVVYEDVRRFAHHYDSYDMVALVFVGIITLILFVNASNPIIHGLWHILGALSLYFALEILYRPVSLLTFHLYDRRTNNL